MCGRGSGWKSIRAREILCGESRQEQSSRATIPKCDRARRRSRRGKDAVLTSGARCDLPARPELTSLTSYSSAAAMASRVSSLDGWTRPLRIRFRVAAVPSANAAMTEKSKRTGVFFRALELSFGDGPEGVGWIQGPGSGRSVRTIVRCRRAVRAALCGEPLPTPPGGNRCQFII